MKSYPTINPCKDCKDRKVGCHSTCEKYNQWKSSGIDIERPPEYRFIDFSKTKKGGEKRYDR